MRKRRPTNVIAPVIVAASILLIFYFGGRAFQVNVSKLIFDDLPFDDLATALIELKVEQSRQLFDLGLLLLGGLWATVIMDGRKTTPVKINLAEMLMFWSASSLLVLSQLSHVQYLGSVYDAVLTGASLATNEAERSIPNVFISEVERYYVAQFAFLLGGVVAGAATFISARFSGGNRENQ